VFDGGAELATARATAALEAGRPLRPSERRQVRREVLGQPAGQQADGQSQRRGPTIDEYLESLSERQRDEIEQSDWFQNLDERHQADVRRRLAVLEEVEAEAEYEFAVWKEEQELAAQEDTEAWPEEEEEEEEEEPDFSAAALARQSDAAYSDDVAEGWGLDEEEEEEE
jgi:hypothetical protein